MKKNYSVIKAKPNDLFKGFCDKVLNARREGDKQEDKAIIAECMKLVGNSAFGRTGMNKNKHSSTTYETDINKARKKVNKYMTIATNNLIFLDMYNYLAPGTSYDKYIKAYGAELQKGFFPYEWLNSIDKLELDRLPPFESFYSDLRSSNCLVTEEDKTGLSNYQMLKDVWTTNNFRTMKDFLEWYNNLDVIPFIDAIKVQKEFYNDFNLDMFKDGISIPSLAEKILFNEARQTDKPLFDLTKIQYKFNSDEIETKINSLIKGYKALF